MTSKRAGSKMPGKAPKDEFVDEQVDSNNSFDDDGEFANPDIDPHYITTQNPSPSYNVFIPPRTSGGKRKKSKNRRRHSETIWTIVSEQDKHLQQTLKQKKSQGKENKDKSAHTTPLGSPSSSSKNIHKSHRETSPKKKKKEKSKKTSIEQEEEALRKSSFLDNPLFQTDLKNWTLPRVELLWCKDPNCQINIKLWREHCLNHQEQLAHLQVQELLRQQYLFNYPPHHHHQHHQYLSHRQSDPLVLPPDLPPPSSLARRQRIASIPHQIIEERAYPQRTPGVGGNYHHHHHHTPQRPSTSSGPQRRCNHPFHQQGEDDFDGVHYTRVTPQLHHHYHHDHGEMPLNMTLHSLNNLSGARQENTQTGGGSNSSSSKNIMPTSTSIPASSGGSSSAKTTSTGMTSSSTSSGGQITPISTSSGVGDSVHSSRDNNYSSSSSTSSSSSSSEDVSSGSTSVTGFESSESRGSSVPSSLNKPPHPNIINNMESSNNNHKNNSTSNSNHHHNHRSSTLNNTKSYGDSTTAPSSGYPSLPYIPSGYRKPGVCPSCNGLVPSASSATNHHLVPVDPLLSAAAGGGAGGGPLDIIGAPLHHNNPLSSNNLKSDNNAFWNFAKFQHPLQRDHSFHSVGGFTLNGQYNTQVKKRRMVKFCSSHKIALVVSTFSLMVTIGLIITLILMKKRGMMDTMDMMPT